MTTPASLAASHRVRMALNLANSSTLLGLAVAAVGGARLRRRGGDGLWLAEGYRFGFPVASAFTIGNVVLTASTMDALCARLPETLAHEDRHASQYAALGPYFLPLYLASAVWSWMRTGDVALRNPFERHAGLVSGGYLAADQAPPPSVDGLRRLFGSRFRRSPGS